MNLIDPFDVAAQIGRLEEPDEMGIAFELKLLAPRRAILHLWSVTLVTDGPSPWRVRAQELWKTANSPRYETIWAP
jgi:hypothetical protein